MVQVADIHYRIIELELITWSPSFLIRRKVPHQDMGVLPFYYHERSVSCLFIVTVDRSRSVRQVCAVDGIDKMVFCVMFHKRHSVCLGAELLSVLDSAVIHGGNVPVFR